MDSTRFKIISITDENVDSYDLFCLKSKKKESGYQRKLKWFKKRFKEGLRIQLLMVREKRGFTSRGFIEYIPGEYSWRAIDARGYMVIHCLWVVGRNKGKGYGTELLKKCFTDAEGMNGVATVTSERTWLPSKGIFIKNGFKRIDTVLSDFDLYVRQFIKEAPIPRFNIGKTTKFDNTYGFFILKSDQCPYTYTSMKEIEEYAKEHKIPIEVMNITNSKEAQTVPHPYGTYCILLNGEILSYRPIGKKRLVEME
ncbi:MAG: GNAT family N-acetyltransferase [Candidatus Heimdallarchaeota archaeon]|nr:MAG: GNAT family N-acetyltransferase [Candidatus Heimdallarchaeota archaeon]